MIPEALAVDAGMAEPVVLGALGCVAQDLVGLGRLLEHVLGLRIVRVAVGVVLQGELAIGALDLISRGTAADAQHFVVIALVSHYSS
ncbi:hypothetical protein DSECCO2_375850 [anaerobic digester metagenome]